MPQFPLNRSINDAASLVDRRWPEVNCISGALMVAEREWPPFVPLWLWCRPDATEVEYFLPYLDFFGWRRVNESDGGASLIMQAPEGRVAHFLYDSGNGTTYSKQPSQRGKWQEGGHTDGDLRFGPYQPKLERRPITISEVLKRVEAGRVYEGRLLLKRLKVPKETVAQACLSKGKELIEGGHPELGEVTLWLALEADPNLTEAFLVLAQSRLDMLQPSIAFHYADWALETDGNSHEAADIMGKAYRMVGETLVGNATSPPKQQRMVEACGHRIAPFESLRESGIWALEQSEEWLGRTREPHLLSDTLIALSKTLEHEDLERAWRYACRASRLKSTAGREQFLVSLTARYADQLKREDRIGLAIRVCRRTQTLVSEDNRKVYLTLKMFRLSLEERHFEAVEIARQLWQMTGAENERNNFVISGGRAAKLLRDTERFEEAVALLREVLELAPDDVNLNRRLMITLERWGEQLVEGALRETRMERRRRVESEGHRRLSEADELRRSRQRESPPSQQKALELGLRLLDPANRDEDFGPLLQSASPWLGEFTDPDMAGIFALELADADTAPVPDPKYAWKIASLAVRRKVTPFRRRWLGDIAKLYAGQLVEGGKAPPAIKVLRYALRYTDDGELERQLRQLHPGNDGYMGRSMN